MRIQHNVMAMNTHRQLGINQSQQGKSTEKLSSGLRINRAADDAAGLSISEKMRAQIRGLQRASMNAQDGISMIQAAEGALQETHSILQRMRELSVQGANDVNAPEDRQAVKRELDQLALEIDRIATSTNFNGKYVLSGLYEGGEADGENVPESLTDDLGLVFRGPLNLQVGSNTLSSDIIKVSFSGVTAKDLFTEDVWLGIEDPNAIDITTEGIIPQEGPEIGDDSTPFDEDAGEITTSGFQAIVNVIDGLKPDGTKETDPTIKKTGISLINELRSQLGAVQNRLEHTVANVDTIAENMQAAESRIRDVDMAKEMMAFTTSNILNQASTAMLAQANQLPQTVLSLLQ